MHNSKTCLGCYRPLADGGLYHPACSQRLFGTDIPPELPYQQSEIDVLAERVLAQQAAITGVQPKLSLEIKTKSASEFDHARLTIVGLWGRYILKPATSQFPSLPELEDLTMHLAQLAGMSVVPHGILPMQSGELAYITRRIDRDGDTKRHMEDMCQLTERLTEHKYRGSHEQIAKAIQKFSRRPGLDLIYYYEQVVFSFLTGNADMHLKNFSLIDDPGLGYVLSPAYDLVPSVLVMPEDTEELALTLAGKKSRFKRSDFEQAISLLTEKQIARVFARFEKAQKKWWAMIEASFIPPETKQAYKALIEERFRRLGLS